MGDDNPILDLGEERAGFVVAGLNLQNHPEDSSGTGDIPLSGAQLGVRQGCERCSRVHAHNFPPERATAPHASREGAEMIKRRKRCRCR